jgi:hypothetical protein
VGVQHVGVRDVGPMGVTWTARVAWAAVGPVLAAALSVTDVDAVVLAAFWLAWGAGLVALLVPSTVGLTVGRLVVPAAVPWSVATVIVTDETALGIAAVVLAVAAAVTTFSGDFGEVCVQASAYGAERRHLLRPPASFVAPMIVLWAIVVTAFSCGSLLAFDDTTAFARVVGAVLLVAAVVAALPLGRRFHRFARRWLVVVPAGIVLHDPVVLAETVMFRRNRLRAVVPGSAVEGVLDLTGRTWGQGVTLELDEPERFVRSPARPGGAPEQLRAARFAIAPSRPGRAVETLTSTNRP